MAVTIVLVCMALVAFYVVVMLFRIARWIVMKLRGRPAKRIGISYPMPRFMRRMLKSAGTGFEVALGLFEIVATLAPIVIAVAWIIDQVVTRL